MAETVKDAVSRAQRKAARKERRSERQASREAQKQARKADVRAFRATRSQLAGAAGRGTARKLVRRARGGRLTGEEAGLEKARAAGVDPTALLAESQRRSRLGLGLGLRGAQRERFRADPTAFLASRPGVARRLGRTAIEATIGPQGKRAQAFQQLGLEPGQFTSMARRRRQRWARRRTTPPPAFGGSPTQTTEPGGFATPGGTMGAPPAREPEVFTL